MQKKNYYQILGVPPGASNAEIKAAYRRLALIYHPDKNTDDPTSSYVFQEINEAYQILSNNSARADYHRSFEAEGKKFGQAQTLFFSAELLLVKLGHMRKALDETDPYRMNTDAVFEELEQLFSTYHLSILEKENNTTLTAKITVTCLAVISYLPKKEQLIITADLNRLPGQSPNAIADFLKKQGQKWFWDRYKIWVVLFVTVLLCLLLFKVLHLNN